MLGLNRAALAEGMVFAERLAIAPAAFLPLVLATPAHSDVALAKGAIIIADDCGWHLLRTACHPATRCGGRR